MKIIITGALGHIGSYIIRDLSLQFPGSEIVMIDNMMTQRYSSLFNLPTNGIFSFEEGDVNQVDLVKILQGASVLIHLAAITDASGNIDNPQILEENNYLSTFKVSEACIQTDTPLIIISSTSVYGVSNKIVDEQCLAEDLNPQSPYARIKLKEERLIQKLSDENNLKAIIFRFGTTPGMRFHTAVNKFCWQAVMGQPLTVWSSAYDQKRPYLDLIDAANAIAFVVRNDLYDGNIYNILTYNTRVSEIVGTIKEFIPNLTVNFVENRIMNQLSYDVSSERFKSTGFKYKGDLRRGIRETVDLIRQANQ